MTTRRFLAVAAASLALACVCLALAAVFDSPALGVAGLALVLAALVARAMWEWRGAGRQWLLTGAVIAATVLVAFATQRLWG